MATRLRIFVSSPGDVPDERLRSELVVDKLAQDYTRFFRLETYRWEYEPMLASGHFQDVIEQPSAFDIVILILWSRLGTPLPERTALREYRGLDGRAPVTGTEWEFEEALGKARARGAPDLLAFRKTSPAPIDTTDREARARAIAQMDALDAFWKRYFQDEGIFLAAFTTYRDIEEFAARLEEVLRRLIERRIRAMTAAGEAEAPRWLGAPFRGLKVYEFEHAPIFFGRDGVVTKAAELLAKNARSGTAFLMLVGGSGSGKSSLTRAALVPRLMKPQRIEGAAFLRRVVFRPGDGGQDLVLGLAEALTKRGADEGVGLPELLAFGQAAASLASVLRQTADSPDYVFADALGRLTEAGRGSGRLLAHETAKLILVIDQFEEIFTREGVSAVDRTLFVHLLRGLACSGAIWVVATMRSDFWHRAGEIPELIGLTAEQGRLDVLPPTAAELAEIIRKPAQVAGISFETHPQTHLDLDSVLIEDAAGAPGVLPLLSFALDALYRKDVESGGNRVLTFATYEALGGLQGAIASEAEKTVASLPADALSAVPRVLRALVTVAGVDRIPVARAVPIANFAEGSRARAVVDTLIEARLLTAAAEGAVATVRLAHEALLSHWQRARDQMAADRRDLEIRALVEAQYLRWTNVGESVRKQLLLRDPDLVSAVDLKVRWGDELPPELAAFIERSRRAAISAARYRRAIAAAVILWALAAVGALLIAERQRNDALIAESRALARDAQANAGEGDTTLAMLLVLRALPHDLAAPDRPFVHEAAFALENALANRRDLFVLDPGEGPVPLTSAVFSPDGKLVATASRDGSVRVWDGATGKMTAPLGGGSRPIMAQTFAPDGKELIEASRDGTVRIWDVIGGRTIAVLRASTQSIRSVAVSPDGSQIATASDDTTTRLWNARTGALVAVLRGQEGPVNWVAFSPDGRSLVTAEWNGAAHLWNAANGTVAATFRGHEDAIWTAAFSPDGSRIVSASRDGTARVWDARTGEPIAVLRGHNGQVYSAAFSPDGTRVVTGSEDGTARLWNAETAAVLAILRVRDGEISAASFSPDGRRVLTASTGNSVDLWNARTGEHIGALVGHEKSVASAVFAPDGLEVLTASADGTARLWRVEVAALSNVLRGHQSYVYQGGFSPDGHRVVTASADKTVRIWDSATGKQLAEMRGHDDEVWSAVFSPQGDRVASGSEDKTVRLWDAQTAAISGELKAEAGILSVAFSPDGSQLLAGAENGSALIWDTHTTGLVGELLPRQSGKVNSVAISADGLLAATGAADGAATLWDTRTRKVVRVLRGHAAAVSAVAFSPDGSQLATGSADKTVRLWDTRTGNVMRVIRALDHAVNSVQFSRDGHRLGIAGWGNSVAIFDAATGERIMSLPGHDDTVWSAAFSPSGGALVTASEDMTARIWQIPARCQQLIAAASAAVPRKLSAAERARFSIEEGATDPLLRIYGAIRPWITWALPRAGDRCE